MGHFLLKQRQGEVSRQHSRPNPASPVPSIAREVLRNSGEELHPADAEFAGSRLHFDFRKVRIHTDQRAAESAAAIGASAYTYGSHVVFGAGRYQPQTSDGRGLLMHELAHVAQQSGIRAENSSPAGLGDPGSRDEAVAAQQSKAALAGGPPSPPMGTMDGPAVIQRQPEKASPGASASSGPQSSWSLGDPRIDFAISHQISHDVSLLMHSFSEKAEGPGFTTWSNQRVFSIVGGEHTWLHTDYWVDTPEHPIPWDQYKPAVFNEIKFTPAGGSAGMNVRYEDPHPVYQGPGSALRVTLGNTSPGAADLPIVDLPLNGGGALVWRAGFRFGEGGEDVQVKANFQLQSAISPAPATPGTTGSTAPSTTTTPAPEGTGGKGQPMPPSPSQPQKKASGQTVRDDIQFYTDGVKKAQDAATRDPLVRKLRDALAAAQPFLPAKDAQKMIDDAIRSLVKDGIDAGIKAILSAVAGKSPTAMPPEGSSPPTGPYPPSGVPGQRIIPGPTMTIPDTPKPRPATSFHFKGGPQKSYAPGDKIKFTVVPPDDFLTMSGSKRVVIVAESDRSVANPTRLDSFRLESASPTKVELTAPGQPGKYVIRVDIGMSFEDSSMEDFEVTGPAKK